MSDIKQPRQCRVCGVAVTGFTDEAWLAARYTCAVHRPPRHISHHRAAAEERIRAALELLELYVPASQLPRANAAIRAAMEEEKPATAEELVQGTQSLSFEEKDEATGFIPLAVDKTYEEEDALLRPSQRPLRCVDCRLAIDWDETAEAPPKRCQGCWETHQLHEEIKELKKLLKKVMDGYAEDVGAGEDWKGMEPLAAEVRKSLEQDLS